MIPTIPSPKVRVSISLDQKVCSRLEKFMAEAHHKTVSSEIGSINRLDYPFVL